MLLVLGAVQHGMAAGQEAMMGRGRLGSVVRILMGAAMTTACVIVSV